jgi:hypothetical protein
MELQKILIKLIKQYWYEKSAKQGYEFNIFSLLKL